MTYCFICYFPIIPFFKNMKSIKETYGLILIRTKKDDILFDLILFAIVTNREETSRQRAFIINT